jgi:transposase InsO family protein
MTTRQTRKTIKYYTLEVPGDPLQMDTCEITKHLYQDTTIDACIRLKGIKLYAERIVANSLNFLESVIEELPFPIQRIQTDRGMEFFAYEFQQRLMNYAIQFRPIKPRSLHLNGKVERTQKTHCEEAYSMLELSSPDPDEKLREWQDYYNHERPHGSLKNQTPWEEW